MLQHMARSSSGSGRRPLKAEITSSNLVRATIDCSRLLQEPFFMPMVMGARHPDRFVHSL